MAAGRGLVQDQDEQEVELAALRLLAAREHSRAELRRKLAGRQAKGAVIERVLDRLEDQNALNERRFVEAYVSTRRRRGFGPRRIRLELRDKGIAAATIDEWLDESDSEWDTALRQAIEKKFGTAPAKDFKERARQGRFLEYRGFAPERIRAAMGVDD